MQVTDQLWLLREMLRRTVRVKPNNSVQMFDSSKFQSQMAR